MLFRLLARSLDWSLCFGDGTERHDPGLLSCRVSPGKGSFTLETGLACLFQDKEEDDLGKGTEEAEREKSVNRQVYSWLENIH